MVHTGTVRAVFTGQSTVLGFDLSTVSTSDENKVIRIAKCDVFSGVCESIR